MDPWFRTTVQVALAAVIASFTVVVIATAFRIAW